MSFDPLTNRRKQYGLADEITRLDRGPLSVHPNGIDGYSDEQERCDAAEDFAFATLGLALELVELVNEERAWRGAGCPAQSPEDMNEAGDYALVQEIDRQLTTLHGRIGDTNRACGLEDVLDRWDPFAADANWPEQAPRGALACYSACQNCDWHGPNSALGEIADYDQRVSEGEPEPTGECPECGCLCQPSPRQENDEPESEETDG